MRYSRMLIPTLRENPSDAESISHKLMLRAGYVRQLAAGLYIYLPLAVRVMEKINIIIREEMERIGAQEVSMPILHPAEVWRQTGRWNEIGDEMFRLKDRTGRDMCLAMTHEEIMTWLASKEIRSYKDMPQIWYQLQTKLRDEARPKSGLLRTREFIMKDSYSFDVDNKGLEISYQLHEKAYNKIYSRCGLDFFQVESDPGVMGGAAAHEYMAPSDAGEDIVIICDSCGYAANIELAESVPDTPDFIEMSYEEIHTPDKKTIKDVSAFMKLSPNLFIKSLLFIADKKPALALVRGDQELHEMKFLRLVGENRPAKEDEIEKILGVSPGFIGPMGHDIAIIADISLKKGAYVTGANKKDFHVKGVIPETHFKAQWEDIHIAKENDGCPKCITKSLRTERVIEIGNIFKLGVKYSKPLNAVYLNKEGKEMPIIMGSYGIGPARIAAAAIEQNNDDDGIIWNSALTPFALEIIPLNMNDPETVSIAENIYNILTSHGIDALLDDRNERPGVKFKDADLIGIPYKLIIGGKSLKQGYAEIKNRRSKEIEKIEINNIDKLVERIIALVKD